MRNKLIKSTRLLLSIVLLTTISYAAQSQMSFGGKLGYTQGTLAQYASPVYDAKSGIAIGGFFQYDVLDFVSVSAELFYVRQGASNLPANLVHSPFYLTALSADLAWVSSTDIVMNSFEIPLTVKITSPDFDGDVKPYGTLGWSLGFITKVTAKDDYVFQMDMDASVLPGVDQYNIRERGPNDISKHFEDVNSSLVLGGGIEFTNCDLPFFMDFKYLIGLNRIDNLEYSGFSTPDYGAIGDTEFSKNMFMITIGMGIGL